MIPRWLANKRHETCLKCEVVATCQDKVTMLDNFPRCPLQKLHSINDEIKWAQAWPEGAPKPTDCCGSALNY